MSDRYVVLGVAHVRSAWFREVSRWATSAAVAIDFVKCVSADELRARLASGRPFSAILADAGLPGIDRELVEHAGRLGCATVLVDDGSSGRDLSTLAAAAVLPATFDAATLVATLEGCSSVVGTGAGGDRPAVPSAEDRSTHVVPGRIVAVTGAGGTGTSVAAMALARGLVADPSAGSPVVLADLALHADQAMLHDARDIVPGVQELVEAFRHTTPGPDEIEALTFGDGHPYRLLLGLRRHRDWATLRPRPWLAALAGLQRTFGVVVADVDADVEGEAECGSVDVEERNLLARSVTRAADAVVVTLTPSAQGVHRAVRVIHGLAEHGVPVERIQPVVMRAPRGVRPRAEVARALSGLVQPALGPAGNGLPAPLFIGEHRKLEQSLRDGLGPPAAMGTALAGAVRAVLARATTHPGSSATGATPAMAPADGSPAAAGGR